jgi:cold shock CspA family protein
MSEKGTVKFFDTKRGFGFVIVCEGAREVFVHASACERSGVQVKAGDSIEFTTKLGKNGTMQVDAITAGGTPCQS